MGSTRPIGMSIGTEANREASSTSGDERKTDGGKACVDPLPKPTDKLVGPSTLAPAASLTSGAKSAGQLVPAPISTTSTNEFRFQRNHKRHYARTDADAERSWCSCGGAAIAQFVRRPRLTTGSQTTD